VFNFDPNDPRQMGLLMAAARMLEPGPGGVGGALSRAVPTGLMGYQTTRGLNDRRAEEEQQRRMREFTIKQAEEQRAQQGQMRSLAQSAFGPNPNMVAGDDEGNAMPQAPGGGGMPEFAKGMMGIDPMMAIQMMPKPQGPMKVGKGDRLVDPTTYKEVLGAAPDLPTGMVQGLNGQMQYDPNYLKGQEQIRRAGASNTTVKLPQPEKAILKVDEERLGELSTAASSARRFAQTSSVINGLLKGKGGGSIVKVGTETARMLGLQGDTIAANDLVESLNTRLATEVRAPGSGSTSNLEFEAYRSAVPSLKNSEEGRDLMTKVAVKFADRNAKLADYGRSLIRQGKFSDQAIAEYDEKLGSVLGNELKKKLDVQQGGQLSPAEQSELEMLRKKLRQ
jgi:hypothetical protein